MVLSFLTRFQGSSCSLCHGLIGIKSLSHSQLVSANSRHGLRMSRSLASIALSWWAGPRLGPTHCMTCCVWSSLLTGLNLILQSSVQDSNQLSTVCPAQVKVDSYLSQVPQLHLYKHVSCHGTAAMAVCCSIHYSRHAGMM